MTYWLVLDTNGALAVDFIFRSRAQAETIAAENTARTGQPLQTRAVGLIEEVEPPALPAPPR